MHDQSPPNRAAARCHARGASGLVSGLPRWLLRGAAALYGCGVSLRNHRLDRGAGVRAVSLPVISVGNLTAGGTGKTPVVIWIVRRLQASGVRPAIALRGYRAARGEDADEVRELREALGAAPGEATGTAPVDRFDARSTVAHGEGVPLIVGANRYRAISSWLASNGSADCIVLDDGFQHRMLARDVDLVLIDAQRPALEDGLLPAGWLREPAAALRRATAVLVTRCEAPDPQLARRIADLCGREPIAWSNHVWTSVRRIAPDGTITTGQVTALHGLRVAVALGIGHPQSMERALEAAGADIAYRAPVRDHHHYTPAMMQEIAAGSSGADALVTTAKDLVKIAPLIAARPFPLPIIVPQLTLDVHTGADELAELLMQAVRRR